MRIHCSRCRTAEYTVTLAAAGTGAVGLEAWPLCATTRFVDCLLVRVGAERGDAVLIGAAAQIVHRIAADTRAAIIIVDGFTRPRAARRGHRRHSRSVLTDTMHMLSELAERLQERGNAANHVPSGWSKTWEAELLDDPGSQCVIELTLGEEPVIWSAADVWGWSSRCGPLFRP